MRYSICAFDRFNQGHNIIGTDKGTTSESRRQYASMVVGEPKHQQVHMQIQHDQNDTGSWSLVLVDPRTSRPDQSWGHRPPGPRSQGG